jgi:hypothetical protein
MDFHLALAFKNTMKESNLPKILMAKANFTRYKYTGLKPGAKDSISNI